MNPMTARVADAVYQNSPDVRCFDCLAAQQGLSEHDVRAVAVVLVARGRLSLDQRICCACGRTDEMLVSANAT